MSVASIVQINSHPVSHEKPSAVKKLLKPHKNILQLVVERNGRNNTNNDTGQSMFMQEEWSDDTFGSSKRSSVALSSSSTPTYKRRNHVVPETLTQASQSECYEFCMHLPLISRPSLPQSMCLHKPCVKAYIIEMGCVIGMCG